MKINTITCHDVYNVGASLQAYALAAYLGQQGHDVSIINYKPDYLRHYELTGVRNPKFDRPILREIYQILKFPGRLKAQFDPRKKAFDAFTRQYLPVTEQPYKNNEELKRNPPEAEVYIAGSDQIWNPIFRNGKDPAFFLDFVPEGRKKLSYAASFAVDSLSEEDRKRMQQWLHSFHAISVREKSGAALIEQMGLKAHQVCDPVFLLKEERWMEFMQKNDRSPYLFVYDFDSNPELMEIAKHFAAEKKLNIVSAFPAEGADEVAVDMGPIAFLNLVCHADVVLSNSFHATAFSILFEKEFYVMNRRENINTRMRDLLQDLGLEKRFFALPEAETERIDWSTVKEKLAEIRKASESFLRENIS